jgi:phosphoglycolate phosphatase
MENGASWPRAVLFDLDGTLIDSVPDLAESLNEVLRWRGLPPISFDKVRGMVGGGIPALITRALEEHGVASDDVHPLVGDMVEIYSGRATRLTTLYDGAEDVLRVLTQAGVALAVCTNKLQHVTDIILRDLGIARYFSAVIGARPEIARKPNPASLRIATDTMNIPLDAAVMIGDSRTDAGAARAAGIPIILTEFGYAPEMLPELAPDAVLTHFSDLPHLLTTLRNV